GADHDGEARCGVPRDPRCAHAAQRRPDATARDPHRPRAVRREPTQWSLDRHRRCPGRRYRVIPGGHVSRSCRSRPNAEHRSPAVKLTPQQRDQIAADATVRYRAGESWAQIGAAYGITGAYTYRLTTARHNITYRRWGQQPIADANEVIRRRQDGQSLDQIADALECSRQALRTALETAGGTLTTRYPRLAERRLPADD